MLKAVLLSLKSLPRQGFILQQVLFLGAPPSHFLSNGFSINPLLSSSFSLLSLLQSSKTNVQHLGGVQPICRGLRGGMLLLPLLLQITVFLFIRLPQRMAVRSKKIVLRKLRKGLKKYDYVTGERGELERGEALGVQGVHDLIIEGKSWVGDRSSSLEAEKMWGEFVEEEGLFWFGSFWGTGS